MIVLENQEREWREKEETKIEYHFKVQAFKWFDWSHWGFTLSLAIEP